jgi:putative hydrolase of the HAD superfamily
MKLSAKLHHGRALFFDVDGVVVHGYHAKPEKRRRWDEHILLDLGIDPDAFTRLFIRDSFEKNVLTGHRSLMSALGEVLPQLGFSGSPMRLVDYWLTRDSNLNFQLLDLIRELRIAGIGPIYLATNQEHLRAFHLWTGLGLKRYFDDIFYAARLGVLKPHPDFFTGILKVIGEQQEPPIFFDDSERVVGGASAFGWEGVLYETVSSCLGHPWIADRLRT